MPNLATCDLHIHTSYSACATPGYGVLEILEVASQKELKVIGITDHFDPRNGIEILHSLQDQINRAKSLYPHIQIILGVEADVLTIDGELTINQDTIAKTGVELVIAGTHWVTAGGRCLPRDMKAKIHLSEHSAFQEFFQTISLQDFIADWQDTTRAIMANPLVSIFAHPVQWPFIVTGLTANNLIKNLNQIMPPEMAQEILIKAQTAGIAWEVNPAYLEGPGSWSGLYDLFKLCNQYNVKISLASDAHHPDHVGKLTNAIRFLKACKINPNLIISSPDQLRKIN